MISHLDDDGDHHGHVTMPEYSALSIAGGRLPSIDDELTRTGVS